MCLGIPAEVVALGDGDEVTVEVSGVSRVVSTTLLDADALAVGDWVLVHVGFALSTIDADEAAATLDQIAKLGGDVLQDELDAMAQS